MFASAFFQRSRKSRYSFKARTRAASDSAPCRSFSSNASARASPRGANAPVHRFQTILPRTRIFLELGAAPRKPPCYARHRQDCPPLVERVLIDLAILHDLDKVVVRVRDEVEVRERVAVDQNQVGLLRNVSVEKGGSPIRNGGNRLRIESVCVPAFPDTQQQSVGGIPEKEQHCRDIQQTPPVVCRERAGAISRDPPGQRELK
jgi:hypothetical protein